MQSSPSKEPFRTWKLDDGSSWVEYFCEGKDYLLRFPGLVDFQVRDDARFVAAVPVPGADRAYLEHIFQSQVLPQVLSHGGHAVFHGAAVEVGNSAIAFLGLSGRGKSTLCASFVQEGHRFLGDDAFAVQMSGELEEAGASVRVVPSQPAIRLWEDSTEGAGLREQAVRSYDDKYLLPFSNGERFCPQVLPLRKLYFLGAGEAGEVEIQPVGAAEALRTLLKHSFLLASANQEQMARHFQDLSTFARWPVFARLDFPREYGYLPEVRRAVLADVARLGQVP